MTAFELHHETLKAMAKFYSWMSIFRNLWKFDFFYGFVGLYGKRSVKKSLSHTKQYFHNLREMITNEFDRKTDQLRQCFSQRKCETKSIILNTASLEKAELQFFSTFLRNLDKKLIINNENFKIRKNTLSITPFVEHVQTKYQQGKQQLAEFYEKYRDGLESVRVINLESISLYKTCVNIGLLLNINSRKIRKAYEQALKSIGGNVFECNQVLIMVG